MCFERKFVFCVKKMLNTLKKYVLADSRCSLGADVCLLFFKKPLAFFSEKNTSCHLVCLTA